MKKFLHSSIFLLSQNMQIFLFQSHFSQFNKFFLNSNGYFAQIVVTLSFVRITKERPNQWLCFYHNIIAKRYRQRFQDKENNIYKNLIFY